MARGGGLVFEELPARAAELAGLRIHRALPRRGRRMVGAWCFLDRYGPLSFTREKPMDVGAHPHIGLQTFSWLVEGEIVHNDSLGCEGLIRPGEVSLMTAGPGIAHSEETPRENTGRLHGVQLWVALPEAERGRAASYRHYRETPALELAGGVVRVMAGETLGARSELEMYSELVGLDIEVHAGGRVEIPARRDFEYAALPLKGGVELGGERLNLDSLYYLGMGRDSIRLGSRGGGRVLLIGGAPFEEPVVMWWNFVARTAEEIRAAREDWEQRRRFGEIPGFRGERIGAPAYGARPVDQR